MRKLLLALALILAPVPALAAACPPIPALPDTERRTEYSGIVSQTGPFNVSFQLYGDSTDYGNWLSVWVNGVQKTPVTDFTVATASGPAIGSACLPIQNAQVTFTAAQTGTIEIVGARRPRRASQFSENAGVTAHSLNQVISDLTAVEREFWDAVGRTMRAPPGETLTVLPPAATRAGNILAFDSNGNPSLTSPGVGLGNVIGPNSSKVGNLPNFNSTLGTLLADSGTASASIARTIEDSGALTSNSAAANLTAIQAAINATPAGGTLKIMKPGYNVAGTLTISKNMKLVCANPDPTVAANLTQTTTSADLIHIRAGYVTIQGCSFGLAGSPSGNATGITIGDDAISASGIFNGTTTLNCGTCTFTSADVGKGVYASGMGAAGGPLFTSISSITDTHHVVMALAATGSGTVTFGYGFNYQEDVIVDSTIYNFITGINVVAATQYHIRHVYALGSDPLVLQNILWSDQGDGSITESTFIASVAGVHNTVNYVSGGGLRFMNNKVLAEAAISNCIQVAWSGASSVGPWMIGNSIEGGCTSGIAVNGTAAGTVNGGIIEANEIGIASGGTGINANPTTAHPNWTIANNIIRETGGGSAILLTNMTNFNASNNNGQNIDANGSGILYNIGSTSSGHVNVGSTNITNSIQNASTNVVIDNPVGFAFAKLPAQAANGSRIFISDADPNTSPCTHAGAQTGSAAFRQNGAWTCGTAVTNPLTVSLGGTGATTLGNHGVLLGQGTAAIGAVGVGATGTVLIGQTAADPIFSASPTVTTLNKYTFTAPASGTTVKMLDGGTNAFDQTANVYFGVTTGNFSLNAAALGLFSKNNSTNGNGIHVESSNAILEVFAGNSATYLSSPSNVPLNIFLNGAQKAALSAAGDLTVTGSYGFTNIWGSATAPTISAGFCATSPSITANNGTMAFDINVGTSCSGSVGTLGMPTAATGWVCSFANVTNPNTNLVSQTGGANNTVTLTNYVRTTGVAGNFTASDHIRAMCHAY